MDEQILQILEESSAYNLRNEVRDLAESLMSTYASKFKKPITNHIDYYQLAFKSLIGAPLTLDTPVQDYRIYADYQEIRLSIQNLANHINVLDQKINNEEVQTDIVFILADYYSMFVYYGLSQYLDIVDSPILILPDERMYDKINTIDPESHVYILGYHEHGKFQDIKAYLLKNKTVSKYNINAITVLGKRYQDSVTNISLIKCDNDDVIISAHGLGKPDLKGKWSELGSIFISH